jgi:phage tail-like protein
MAVLRESPYAQFNFLVDLGTGATDGPEAGFQEVGPLASTVDVIEYRNGNDRTNSPRKLSGLRRVADVTLKRGLIGTLQLVQWLDQVGNGDPAGVRNVIIHLQNEDHTAIVMTWKLIGARIVRHSSGPLNARGTDVAIEEMTLAYERLELE